MYIGCECTGCTRLGVAVLDWVWLCFMWYGCTVHCSSIKQTRLYERCATCLNMFVIYKVWLYTVGCGCIRLGVVVHGWVWLYTVGCGCTRLGVVVYGWVWLCTVGCGFHTKYA